LRRVRVEGAGPGDLTSGQNSWCDRGVGVTGLAHNRIFYPGLSKVQIPESTTNGPRDVAKKLGKEVDDSGLRIFGCAFLTVRALDIKARRLDEILFSNRGF